MTDISILGLFCHDVRDEVEGTHSIVGVFPDSVHVPSFPGSVPFITVYIRVGFRIDEPPPTPIDIVLIPPSNEERKIQTLDEAFIQKAINECRTSGGFFTGIISRASITGLRVSAAGYVKAIVRCDGREHLAAVLNFKLAPPTASASEPAQPV